MINILKPNAVVHNAPISYSHQMLESIINSTVKLYCSYCTYFSIHLFPVI